MAALQEFPLLKLKKLQILGFKSFCDRTELKFHGDGIAAIIGPNGCGKSNIADAISWVLGEQSAKTLRGSRMEDVIFAGTRDRKPNGMAEVSLTLINPEEYDGVDANEPTEVDIRDDMPDDWDEAEVRAQAAEETERLTEELQPGVAEPGDPPAAKAEGDQEQQFAALKRCATQNPSTQDPEGVVSSEQEQAAIMPGGGNRRSIESGSGAGSAIVAVDGAGRDARATAGEDAGAFAGGSSRPNTGEDAHAPTTSIHSGSAVVLKIRRRKFQQQFRAGEIVVTRRLFRSGDSEYLLNGKLCRLRDIQELFMGTGLGPESYALIEQGRIGQILSSRPTDRRAIIEEAAGITKFKTKKRLAEARLEDAKQNLARVNDIFEEVTRQMNSLKRQASKAERYAKLRDEMRAKLRVVLASKFAQLDHESAAIDAQINSISEEMRAQADNVQQFETEHGERTQRGYAIETELRENRERLNEIKLETDRAQAQRRHNEERCAELIIRAGSSENELAQAQHRLTTLEAERDSNQQVLDSAAADVAAAQEELARCQQEATAAATALAELEQQQEASRIAMMEAVAAASNLRNQLTQAEERLAAVDREGQRLHAEMLAANSQVESFGGQRGQLALEFETVSQRVAGLTSEIGYTRQALESKRREEAESKNRLDGLRAEYASAIGKKGSLEAVIAEHGYSTESVRRLFQSGGLQGGLAPAGVLADFLEVEPRYESVVEDFLRDELNYVVVKSWDAADEGIRLLRADVDGRATFLVHPEDSQAKFSFAVDENARHASPSQSIVPLRHAIRVLNGFGRSLEVILPKLRDGYIVGDPANARGLALENPDAFFLAQSGECFHNVTVTGGKQRSEGPLSMKRELRDVLRMLAELEQALRAEEMRVLRLGREIKELTSLLDRLEGEKREAEKQAMTSGHLLQQLDSEMARGRERLGVSQSELERLRAERNEQECAISARQSEMAALQEKRDELERSTASAQEQLAGLRAQRDQAAENEQIATQLVEFEAERNASAARDGLLQFETEQVRARLAEIDEALRNARQLLEQARDRRGELSAAAAKLQSDAQYMSETCLNELGVQRPELMADLTIPIAEGEQLTVEEQIYREMRTRLDGMGPVNMMALEEYKETAERHAFLETQRKDLLESIENTQATIREIDTFSRQKFEEAFYKINENFQSTFKKLFGGGNAFMRLTDEENSAESGIDVVASPPGKKLQNVLLLSGGEKALTALALLVGIFQYQPSPFCILDEVDAPLDEANVGRFTELVKEMAVQTQFVLITHSKKTMSIAPVLYGVTMQEPGVSKLVSVRFGATA